MLFSTLALGVNKVSLVEFDQLPLNKTQKNRVLAKKVVINSEVETVENGKKQSLSFYIVGKHKRSCRFALKKLKRFELYKDFIGIIKSSTYNQSTRDLSITMIPPIIPGKLSLNFKIDRITGKGVYPFTFEKGFLRGLKGEVHVSEHKHRCLFYIRSKWKGTKTRFPDRIIELLSTTVGQLAMEKLFRISSML